MPKIVFWNIQRGAGRVRPGSEGTDKLNIVLESIAAREKPNLFILCEGQSSAGGNLERFVLVRSTRSWYFSRRRSHGGVLTRLAKTRVAGLG